MLKAWSAPVFDLLLLRLVYLVFTRLFERGDGLHIAALFDRFGLQHTLSKPSVSLMARFMKMPDGITKG